MIPTSGDQILGLAVFGFCFLICPIIYYIATYNRLIRLKNHVTESWSNVDVVLRRRYDLIPNLVETVKAYAAHEAKLFADIAALREAAMRSVTSGVVKARAETAMVNEVNKLLVRIEAYPDLKSSANFLQLQNELVETEDRIAAARRFYNSNVREYNAAIASFPSSIIANAGGHVEEEYFEVDDIRVRNPIQVQI